MTSKPLSDQVVVVVGGTDGIGLAISRAAVESGASVVIASRNAARIARVQAELKMVRVVKADADDFSALKAFFAAVGPVDHLAMTVHDSATGLGVDRTMVEMDLDAAHRFFEAKFWNQYRIAKACIPHLRDSGSIVFTAGVASRAIIQNHTTIGATNGAVEACARQLAREIAPRRVNVVAPGVAATTAYDGMSPEDKRQFLDRIAKALPVGRIGRPDEVAQGYIFAMSCGYLTGAVLDVSGGLLVSGFQQVAEIV